MDNKLFGVYHRVNQVKKYISSTNTIGFDLLTRFSLIAYFYSGWAKSKGFGVEQLRDNCMDTYWQSDGQLPHLVNIQFQRKTVINQLYIYTDYKLDESYTPSRISIRSGTHFNDLQEVDVVDLTEPDG